MPKPILSHYEIVRLIGDGGMGAIYKARDTELNPRRGQLYPSGDSPHRKSRFIQEAQAAASALNHRGVVNFQDLLTVDGEDDIFMEYIDSRTFDS